MLETLNPLYMTDAYKLGHVQQYAEGIDTIVLNWTPRYTYTKRNTVVHAGVQLLIKEYLIGKWKTHFFDKDIDELIEDYKQFTAAFLGNPNPKTDHIRELHALGFLPLSIWSLPEGSTYPLGVPSIVLHNTHGSKFKWIAGYLETLISNIIWGVSTSATTAQTFRQIYMKYARLAGETDFSFVDWMGHDFSMRGMMGIDACILSGIGHLMSFSGTDTLPAIHGVVEFYNEQLSKMQQENPYFGIGGSVPATEHNVMQSGQKSGEVETFGRLINEIYPTGVVSIVSDTWDLWSAVTKILPQFRDDIVNRNGKVVIRPDSGDPVKIMCGDPSREAEDGSEYGYKAHPASYGLIELLSYEFPETVQKNAAGFKAFTTLGGIYGDGISPVRADAILKGLTDKGFSPYVTVFGQGSFSYQWVTRDTHGFAVKQTAIIMQDGTVIETFKDPITDDSKKSKKSLRGIPIVTADEEKLFKVNTSLDPDDLKTSAMKEVFRDGQLLVDEKFSTIRQRVRAYADDPKSPLEV